MQDTTKELSLQLQKALSLNEVVADLLVKRGIVDIDSANKFLYPDLNNMTPLSMYDGVYEVADRLQQALDNGEDIVVYGDYDCDGVCAVAILYGYLSSVSKGSKISYFIPNRHNDGYGLSVSSLDYIAENTNAQVVISVDCGINSVEEVNYAQQELGFDMLITDHHQPGEVLPDCPVFNPHVSAKGDAFKHLCGAGVALRVVEALGGLNESKKYYDIAALATVADVVPLLGDNRLITYFGLISINKKYRRGISLLVDSCIKGSVTSSDIAFKIAPKINAMGRVKDANEVVKLFVETDMFLLKMLVEEINKANDLRQQLTDDLTQDCLEKLRNYDFDKNKFIILYAPYWDDGVLGIAASRIVGMFNRPVILFTKNKGMLKGSGRSIAGINILECIKSGKEYLSRYGGHPMACGLGLEESNFQNFFNAVNEYVSQIWGEEEISSRYDYILDKPLSVETTKQLMLLQPFGEANPMPIFAIDEEKCNFVPFGDGSHIKAKIKNMEVIGFFMADESSFLSSEAKKRLTLEISYSVYNHIEKSQAIIKKVIPEGLVDQQFCALYNLKLRSKGNSQSPDVIFTNETKVEQLANKPYGVCFIALNRQTGIDIATKYNLKLTYGKPADLLPKTQVVLCPINPEVLDYYSTVVFLDKPLFDDTYCVFGSNKQVFCYNQSDVLSYYEGEMPDYGDFATVYKSVKALTKTTKFNSLQKLYEEVSRTTAISYLKFNICFKVFEELGLMSFNTFIVCVEGKRNELANSKLYQVLCMQK